MTRLVFLTMSNLQDVAEQGIYMDLMRKFRSVVQGHKVTIVVPRERRWD